MQHIKRILSYTRRALDDYRMLEAGDRVAVGVSAGKDSLTLLCALAELRRFYPVPFTLQAVTIDMGFPGGMDFDPRRGALYNAAKSLGCNVAALGHHFDDAVETFLLNLFFEGRIGSFSPVSYLTRTGIRMIRPMIYLPEKDIRYFAGKAELPVIPSPCPADGNTQREEMKQLLARMEREHRGLRYRIFGAMQRGEVAGVRRLSGLQGILAEENETGEEDG